MYQYIILVFCARESGMLRLQTDLQQLFQGLSCFVMNHHVSHCCDHHRDWTPPMVHKSVCRIMSRIWKVRLVSQIMSHIWDISCPRHCTTAVTDTRYAPSGVRTLNETDNNNRQVTTQANMMLRCRSNRGAIVYMCLHYNLRKKEQVPRYPRTRNLRIQ